MYEPAFRAAVKYGLSFDEGLLITIAEATKLPILVGDAHRFQLPQGAAIDAGSFAVEDLAHYLGT